MVFAETLLVGRGCKVRGCKGAKLTEVPGIGGTVGTIGGITFKI